MMMKRRGYEIPPEENVWIECSLDESKLVAHLRTLRKYSARDLITRVFNKTYKTSKTIIPDQTTFNFYPYLPAGSESPLMGEFFFREGKWTLTRREEDILTTQTFETEVEFTTKIDVSTLGTRPFSQVANKIFVFIGTEKNFLAETKKMIEYRKRGVEIFHTSELFIDYFQHWLVPEQRVLSDSERVILLSPYLMAEDEGGVFQKIFNCKITKNALPSIHFTDVVMRYIGALPGKIVYWENRSYISSFSSTEFGYMLVSGFKYNENVSTTAERQTFAGEQREEDIDEGADEDLDMEEEMDIDEGDEGDED
jgi:DNA-directed RNA polymerase subunit H (RpoH/RPB5)